MEKNKIIDDAKDWLKEFGYSVHSYSGDKQSVTLTCHDFDLDNHKFFPAIHCREKPDGTRACSISYNGLKLFLSLQSGDLQYRHPDIKRYLIVFVNYAKAMDFINPFSN